MLESVNFIDKQAQSSNGPPVLRLTSQKQVKSKKFCKLIGQEYFPA